MSFTLDGRYLCATCLCTEDLQLHMWIGALMPASEYVSTGHVPDEYLTWVGK